MSGVIFWETLRRSWRGMLMLGGSMAAMGLYIVLILNDPAMVDIFQTKLGAMQPILNLMGGGDAAFMATPEGMINYGYFSWMILILAGYALWVGMSVTSAEEDRGIMDSLLAVPVARWQVVVEKLAAYTLVMAVAVLIGHLGLVIPLGASKVFSGVSTARLLESSINMLPTAVLVMAFSAWIAVVVRRRNTAMIIAVAFLVASYFVDFIGRSVPEVDGLRRVSVFAYYDSVEVMKNGLLWGNLAVIIGVGALLAAGTVLLFRRRDVGV